VLALIQLSELVLRGGHLVVESGAVVF